MKIKITKIAMWSLLTALAMPFAAQVVDYDLSNAVRVMRGAATAINGATVGVVGNHNATITHTSSGAEAVTIALSGQGEQYSLTETAKIVSGLIASGDGRFSTGYGDYIYLTDIANGKVFRYDKNGTKSEYASVEGVGTAITSDDAGNLLVNKGLGDNTSSTSWVIINAQNQSQTPVTFSGFPAARLDQVGRVVGDMTSSAGAYVYLTPKGASKIVAVKIANSQFVSAKESPATSLTFDTSTLAQPMYTTVSQVNALSNVAASAYVRKRGDHNIFSWNGTTSTSLGAADGATNGEGFDVFELGGVKYAVEPASESITYGDGFVIRDLSKNQIVCTHDCTFSTPLTQRFQSITVRPNADGVSVTIYQSVSGEMMAQYTFKLTLPTAPVKNLIASLDESNVATINWSAPNYDTEVATVTGYTVTVGSSSPVTITGTSYSIGEISSSVTVSVVPNYALISDPSTTGSGTAQSVTVKPAGNVGPPRSFTATPYQGRSLVELNWLIPADTYEKPNGYSVYRDGVLILANQNSLQFVDSNVSAGQHEYTVVSIYDGIEYPRCSATTVVSVEPFNTANNVYQIEEVYNYMVGSGDGYDISSTFDGKVFNNRDMWRQGAVFDGKWYIAMGGASSSPGAGIYMFDLNDPRKTPTKLNLSPEILVGQNNGIAFDEAGNIVIRKQWETTPTSAYDIGVGLWNVMVYKRKADGTYETGQKVNLSGLGFIDTAQRVTGFGRVDYYTLKGNIFSSAGAKFPLAITQKKFGTAGNISYTNTQVKDFCLVNLYLDGSTVKARGTSVTLGEPFRIKDYDKDDEKKYNGKFIEECYAFYNAANPNQIILQARSDGYALFNEADLTSNGANGTYIYNHVGATTNSGGTTILWGNDLLFINPYDLNSANMGTFRIAIAENQDLARQIPLINVVQSERSSDIMGNSNGSWIHAEQAVDTDGEECIYIYNYVPATRFSKYKLTRSGTYSFPEPSISIVPENGTSANNTTGDLACYDANLSWERPKTSTGEPWPTDGDNPLKKYIVSVVDKNDNPYTDADGTVYNNYEVTAATTPTFAESTVELPMMKNFDDNEPYTIKVKAVYRFSGKDKESLERTATSRYTYTPNPPALTVVHNVARDVDFNQAWNADGENILVQEKFDIYRINIQLHKPEPVTIGGYTIPVSYYSLEVNKGDGNGWQPVKDYPQYVATGGYSVGSDGKTEVSTYGDHIAGNADLDDISYEFYYFVSHGRTYGPLRAVGDASDEDPSQWQYRLTANYGSSESVSYDGKTYNPLSKGLAKSAYGEAVPSEEVTSVEFIQDCGSLRAYPIPTEGMLNITSPIEITSIEFYSVSGALVKRVKGNGNNDTTVDVSDLAAGTYIVSINGSMSLTIVKK